MRRILSLLIAAVSALALAGCDDALRKGVASLLSPGETYEKESVGGYEFEDLKDIYTDSGGIITMYLTVGKGLASEGADHTWAEVNEHPTGWYDSLGIEPYKCDALLQVGDEIGPLSGEFGYGEVNANATVRLRGKGASEKPQKSYRIDIKNGKGSWNGQKAVLLNKHSADPLRFRQKLAYDLMATIPGMFSARTWFVHLYVKDRSEGEDGLFEDYGLYTAVEQINKKYLRNRNLDADGNFYKAENFDWRPHVDVIMPATSPNFDQNAFEDILEIKGDPDHTKLINMLAAIDREETPIGDIVDKYFDRDNLYSWLAFHILMGNRDIEAENYYLYSPQGSDEFYFISWDNDKILPEAYEKLKDENFSPGWSHGIFPLVSARLFERMFQDAECRQRLQDTVDDLRENYLTDEAISEAAVKYSDLIKSSVFSYPDSAYERVTESDYDILTEALTTEIESNYKAFCDSLSEPWPFNISAPAANGDKITFSWEDAYLYGGKSVYTVELSQSPDFENCIFSLNDLDKNEYTCDALPEGQYFLYVRANGPSGYSQDAKQYYLTETDRTVFGTLCFYVAPNGGISVNEYYGE